MRHLTPLKAIIALTLTATANAQLDGPVVPPPATSGAAEIKAPAATATAVINPFAPRIEYNHNIHEPETESLGAEITERILHVIEGPTEPLAYLMESLLDLKHDHTKTKISHNYLPIQPIPQRPELPIELGERFLAPGWLGQGQLSATGEVVRPAFWVFGTFRTGINHFNNRAGNNSTEWVNRLDLFTQLNLSGTERVVAGFRPFDEEKLNTRRFAGYDIRNADEVDPFNVNLQTLFFEGDFGEIFPGLDPYDALALDYGFSVGRQPMSFQQGLLVNEDRIDAVTVTRNTLSGGGVLNLRATGVYGFNSINRNNNMPDHDAQLVGLFTETDTKFSTINADVAYVDSQSAYGSLLTVAVSGIQRFHGVHNTYNSSLHALVSIPTDGETAASGQGELLFSQFSWTPHHTNDLVYLNTFWAIDQFTSAARGPLAGGPLGQAGILFSAPGLGNYGAPLSNQASEAVGGSLGYQLFFCETKRQMLFEVGARSDTNGTNDAAVAGGFRYQEALDQHWLLIVDSFLAKRESRGLSPGIRFELQMKF